ncbi:hypothetical protein [Lysinibacillus alkalisoli]|uniref:hypothetical protein n=1 Tax=Lysinibacillus alkalisoli TaxID=1911548 RepID=UPI001E2AAFB4|nr:hypothetical protein [Lysinibacillus alkalisoli]
MSAAWMYIEPNTSFVSLWGDSTLVDYRGKVLYTAASSACEKAYERGYRLLTVDASPMSAPILKKQGFHCLATCYEYQSPR